LACSAAFWGAGKTKKVRRAHSLNGQMCSLCQTAEVASGYMGKFLGNTRTSLAAQYAIYSIPRVDAFQHPQTIPVIDRGDNPLSVTCNASSTIQWGTSWLQLCPTQCPRRSRPSRACCGMCHVAGVSRFISPGGMACCVGLLTLPLCPCETDAPGS